jgi:outer membrane protein assembly factor BamB
MLSAIALSLFLFASVPVRPHTARRSATIPPASAPAAELAGAWAGTVSHEGESTPVGLELEPGPDGKVLVKLSNPVVHLRHVPIARVPIVIEGTSVRFGPFAFTYDREARTLTGIVPEGLAPLYVLPLTLQHVDHLDLPERPRPAAPLVAPVWTFDAGAPLWPGPALVGGSVVAGGDDGRLHALDPATGQPRWTFQAGGPIRTRAAGDKGAVYLQADDGVLYALDGASGQERWRARVVEKPITRLPPSEPTSRYDHFGSDVVVDGPRLFLGTHDGRVLCLEAATGKEAWHFASGDSVLAAPAVDADRVYFGSYDGAVYALDKATGALVWKHATGKPVVSTPAVADDRVIVGSRSYDLLGLEAKTGRVAWTRYIWFSWVDSAAVVRDGVAYVGSSDAAAVYAFDARTGRPVWKTDVWGWAWGQPAVTERRVYMGTSALAGYPVPHEAALSAIDRKSGRLDWRFTLPAAKDAAYGFPGSAAVGGGRVFVSGLDGRVYAFAE